MDESSKIIQTIPKDLVCWCCSQTEMAIHFMSCGEYRKDTQNRQLSLRLIDQIHPNRENGFMKRCI